MAPEDVQAVLQVQQVSAEQQEMVRRRMEKRLAIQQYAEAVMRYRTLFLFVFVCLDLCSFLSVLLTVLFVGCSVCAAA